MLRRTERLCVRSSAIRRADLTQPGMRERALLLDRSPSPRLQARREKSQLFALRKFLRGDLLEHNNNLLTTLTSALASYYVLLPARRCIYIRMKIRILYHSELSLNLKYVSVGLDEK